MITALVHHLQGNPTKVCVTQGIPLYSVMVLETQYIDNPHYRLPLTRRRCSIRAVLPILEVHQVFHISHVVFQNCIFVLLLWWEQLSELFLGVLQDLSKVYATNLSRNSTCLDRTSVLLKQPSGCVLPRYYLLQCRVMWLRILTNQLT